MEGESEGGGGSGRGTHANGAPGGSVSQSDGGTAQPAAVLSGVSVDPAAVGPAVRALFVVFVVSQQHFLEA